MLTDGVKVHHELVAIPTPQFGQETGHLFEVRVVSAGKEGKPRLGLSICKPVISLVSRPISINMLIVRGECGLRFSYSGNLIGMVVKVILEEKDKPARAVKWWGVTRGTRLVSA